MPVVGNGERTQTAPAQKETEKKTALGRSEAGGGRGRRRKWMKGNRESVVRPVKPKLELGTGACTSSHLGSLASFLLCALQALPALPAPYGSPSPRQAAVPRPRVPKRPKRPKRTQKDPKGPKRTQSPVPRKCQSRGLRGSVLNHRWSPHIDSSA